MIIAVLYWNVIALARNRYDGFSLVRRCNRTVVHAMVDISISRVFTDTRHVKIQMKSLKLN